MCRDRQQSSNDFEIRKESVDYSSYATTFQSIPRTPSNTSNTSSTSNTSQSNSTTTNQPRR